jgi:hypothetical protein
MFLFYGFLFFTNSIEAYNNPIMHIFAGIFVSGGFLITFGQFVPSWDSAYSINDDTKYSVQRILKF